MTHANKDVALACVVDHDSGGVIIAKPAYIKFVGIPEFIRSMLHSLA